MSYSYSSHNGMMQFTFTGLPSDATLKEAKALARMVYAKDGYLTPTKTGYTTYVSRRSGRVPSFFSGIVFHNPHVRSLHQTISRVIPMSQRSTLESVLSSAYFCDILSVLGITGKTFLSEPELHIRRYLEDVVRLSKDDDILMRKRLVAIRSLWTQYLATEERPILFYRGSVAGDTVLRPDPIVSIKMRPYDGSLMDTLHKQVERVV